MIFGSGHLLRLFLKDSNRSGCVKMSWTMRSSMDRKSVIGGVFENSFLPCIYVDDEPIFTVLGFLEPSQLKEDGSNGNK